MGRKEGEYSSQEKQQRYEVVTRPPNVSVHAHWGLVKNNFSSYHLLST